MQSATHLRVFSFIAVAMFLPVGWSGSVQAAALAEPAAREPIPPGGTFLWGLHPDESHVRFDASGQPVVIDLTTTAKPLVDLEIHGLTPRHNYTLANGEDVRSRLVNPDGWTMFWRIAAEPASWTLRDVSGDGPSMTIRLSDVPERDALPIQDHDGHLWAGIPSKTPVQAACDLAPSGPECSTLRGSLPVGGVKYQCDGPSEQCSASSTYTKAQGGTPQPSDRTFGQGRVPEEAALSYTDTASVAVNACYDHTVSTKIDSQAGLEGTGQSQAQTFAYESSRCNGLTAKGQPLLYMTYRSFEKDTYSDGSFNVFQYGDGLLGDYVGPYEAPEIEAGLIHVVSGTTQPTYVSAKEAGANTFVFTGKVGVKVDDFGVGGSAAVTPSATWSVSTVITFTSPDTNEHRWTYNFKTGAGDGSHGSGFIGMVWRDY